MSAIADNFTAQVKGIWSWWSDEMLSMAPASWRGEATARNRFDVLLHSEETILEIVQNGEARRMREDRNLENLDDEAWLQIEEFSESHGLRLFLNPGDFLEIPVSLPKASTGQLRSAISLQLPTLTPIVPEQIDWNFLELGQTEKEVNLSLAIARSSRLDALEAIFAERGLMPPQFCVAVGDQNITLRKPLELAAKPMSSKVMLTAIFATAMIAMIPISTIAGAKMLTSLNEDRIARLEKDLGPKLAREREAQRAEKIKRAAAPLFNLPSASNRLEALAAGLPSSDWTVASTQHGDGGFEFIVDMADRETAETAFRKNALLKNVSAGEEIPTDNARSRVRYRIGQ